VPLPAELSHSPGLTSMSQREAAAVPCAVAGGKCPRAGADHSASASVAGPGAPSRPGGPGLREPPRTRIAVHCEPPGAGQRDVGQCASQPASDRTPAFAEHTDAKLRPGSLARARTFHCEHGGSLSSPTAVMRS
jgi:hypothetical protein